MSSGSVRRVSRQDIQLVQNLIERCLQLYMSPKEVVNTLEVQAKIEPDFTELATKPLACYPAEQTPAHLRPENMQHRVESSLSNVFNNDGPSLGANMHAVVDMSAHGNRINGPPSMLSAQNSNIGLIQGINGGMIKSAPGYSSCSPYMFGADGNVLEARQTVSDASVSLFTNVEANTHTVNEAVVDPDTSSFGFLGQIPRNFSLSDLTAHFSQSSADILESYCRSPFLPTDNENILERREQVDNNRLDSISESLSYEDFDNE